jgi:hypothetical protein
MKAGIFAIPASDYLGDASNDVPTLNSSSARVLLAESPRHAFWAHPKLSPMYVREEKTEFDLGSAAHALVLEGDESGFEVIEAPDYRTKAAQAVRDSARANGRTPLLPHQLLEVREMATAVRLQLDAFSERPIPLRGGKPEQTLVWNEDDVWLRARLDYLHDGRAFIDDLKTGGGSAHPDAWAKRMYSEGYDVQCAFYLRGIKALFGIDATFRFIVVENWPPYAISVVSLAPDALELAQRKVTRAIGLWRESLTSGDWPGYPTRTCYVEAPPWEMAKFETGEYVERGPGIALADL